MKNRIANYLLSSAKVGTEFYRWQKGRFVVLWRHKKRYISRKKMKITTLRPILHVKKFTLCWDES